MFSRQLGADNNNFCIFWLEVFLFRSAYRNAVMPANIVNFELSIHITNFWAIVVAQYTWACQ